jgi:hypothetical protein
MAIDFPNSPSINDVHSDGLASWTWTGYAWKRIPDPGAKGEPGIQGPTGPTGLTGSQGDKGEPGNVLAKGVKGEVGEKGEKGDVFAKGVKGDLGPQGDKGDVGPQGDKGVKGEPGVAVKGEQGDKGELGQKGESIKGEKGATGSLSTASISTPSRSLGTDYQNTTGELMYVITTTLVPTWSNYTISKIGAATNAYSEVFLARDNGSANANNVWVTSVFWVPSNYYYRIDAYNHQNNSVNTNNNTSVRTWNELTFS